MQSPKTGYRWRGHFALVYLLHLCRVFLSLLLWHSTQRTKAPLLFVNDVSGKCAALSSDGDIAHTGDQHSQGSGQR